MPIGLRREILVGEPVHQLFVEEIALTIVALGLGRVLGKVGDGIDQQLELQRRTSAVARHHGDDGREVTARAVTADRDAARVDPELAGVLGDVTRRAVGVLGSRGELVLGREPIVHRYHHAARGIGEATADAIVRVEIADHEPTAVKVDQRRQIVREGGAIHAHGNLRPRRG